MPQQVLTPELATFLAERVEVQGLTALEIERQKFGKNKGKIIAKWTEGEAGSVPGESFAAEVLRDMARDLENQSKIIGVSVKRTDEEYVSTYVVSKEKSNAHQ